MKLLFRLGKEANVTDHYIYCNNFNIILTIINLIAPKLLSNMTGLVEQGVDLQVRSQILQIALTLIVLYLLRIIFRFLQLLSPQGA